MDYESDVKIDPDALDVEWLDQPSLMMRYARVAADARRVMDEAKEDLEMVKAEVDKEIRSDPDRFGISKVTEGTVAAAILLDDRYRKAMARFIDSKYEVEMTRAATSAIDARKSALENLVRLHGQQYFAGPRAPRDLTKEWEEREQQRRSNERIKISRKK